MRYCLSDAAALGPLLAKLVPGIRNFDQALRRGEYVGLTAEICHRGIPFDSAAIGQLQRKDIRQALRLRLVSDQDLTQGLYEGATLKQALARRVRAAARAAMAAHRNRADCRKRPRRSSGSPEESPHSEFAGLAEIKKTRRIAARIPADRRCRRPMPHADLGVLDNHQPDGAERVSLPVLRPRPGRAI